MDDLLIIDEAIQVANSAMEDLIGNLPETELQEDIIEIETEFIDVDSVLETEGLEMETLPETELSKERDISDQVYLETEFNYTSPSEQEDDRNLESEGNETVVNVEIVNDRSSEEFKEEYEKESEFEGISEKLIKEYDQDDDINSNIYSIDDIYNILVERLPERNISAEGTHNINDIYDLLFAHFNSISTLDSDVIDYIDVVEKKELFDDLEVVEVEDEKIDEVTEAESESETENEILVALQENNKLLAENLQIQKTILQNQKMMSDNDNLNSQFLIGGMFALFGAVVIANFFRGFR